MRFHLGRRARVRQPSSPTQRLGVGGTRPHARTDRRRESECLRRLNEPAAWLSDRVGDA